MKSRRLIYGIHDVPPLRESLALGFQHYLTMFGSTVAIPLLLSERLGMKDDPIALGWLIGTRFFVSGITTLLQTTFGNRLPLVQGGTFSFLTPAFAIAGMAALSDAGWQVRLQHIQGAVIAGSLFEIVIGYTGLVGRLLRFVGPVTIAPTIALIGLSLFKFGAPVAGTHWGIGGLTIVLIILFSQYMRRTHRAFELFPIMLGILIAWGVAGLLSATGVFAPGHPAHVSGETLRNAPWFRVPYPFQWGWPVFGLAATVGMLSGYLASIVESVGDYYACSRLAGAPVPGIVLSSTRAMPAPTAIPVDPRVLIRSESHWGSKATGWAAKYSGRESPMKNANPRTNRFRAEFRSTNWRLLSPTAAIIPNIAQYIPPTMGWGMVVNMAPNFPNMARTIMRNPPICTTRRLPTRVRPMAPMFSL